jgi:hypothetical protein
LQRRAERIRDGLLVLEGGLYCLALYAAWATPAELPLRWLALAILVFALAGSRPVQRLASAFVQPTRD